MTTDEGREQHPPIADEAESLAEVGRDPDARQSHERPAAATAAFLVFRVGAHWYAFAAETVGEVVPQSRPVRVPGAPGFVRGVINTAGRVCTVVDVAPLLGEERSAGEGEAVARFVVLEVDGLSMAVAADEVAGVIQVELPTVERTPGEGPAVAKLVDGQRLICVLDGASLVTLAESRVNGG